LEGSACLFKRDHHVRIGTILQSLDGDLLRSKKTFFGGGTAIVLSHGEYCESIDIDFLCSDLPGYRDLRQALTEANNLEPISRSGISLNLMREIRADQYGIRTMLAVGTVEIKLEIIFEGRISLETPSQQDQIVGVSTLSQVDMAATKFLANSDRWVDDSIYCRDLIDLSMLKMTHQTFNISLSKASMAYGKSIKRDLIKAIGRLKNNPSHLNDCMDALKMNSVPKALLWSQIRDLEKYGELL
jgi:hypothetical protein